MGKTIYYRMIKHEVTATLRVPHGKHERSRLGSFHRAYSHAKEGNFIHRSN